jgi:hypothetical protein
MSGPAAEDALAGVACCTPSMSLIRGDCRKLKAQMARSRELPKLESACTTIVTAR